MRRSALLQPLFLENFATTSLDYSTISINGSTASDTVDITGLTSDHRVVFASNGGSDTVIGTPRPQDVFGMSDAPKPDLSRWQAIDETVNHPDGEVTIAVVGKYTVLKDAYKSLIEALIHGGLANNVRVQIDWVESEAFENEDGAAAARLEGIHGILVPGGFGERGSEGKIRAVQFARERRVPYFGICFGMQMAVIEAARNVAGIKGASSTEFGPSAEPVVGLMTEWVRGNRLETRGAGDDLGGTMRLGAFEARLTPGSKVCEIYGSSSISERHRHRYEVNIGYREAIEKAGLKFTGLSPDGVLPEIVDAVASRMTVIFDGGIRRGSHVLKALSVGAKACSGGRLYLYALAAAGQPGVERAIGKLHAEIERGMRLMGARSVADLGRENLRYR